MDPTPAKRAPAQALRPTHKRDVAAITVGRLHASPGFACVGPALETELARLIGFAELEAGTLRIVAGFFTGAAVIFARGRAPQTGPAQQ